MGTKLTEIFRGQHGALLPNQQCGGIRVATDIVRTDRQIGNLETLDTMDIQAFVENAMLDDAIALPWAHGAGSQRVPGGLHVTLDKHRISHGIDH